MVNPTIVLVLAGLNFGWGIVMIFLQGNPWGLSLLGLGIFLIYTNVLKKKEVKK